jgi:hypothetical protein
MVVVMRLSQWAEEQAERLLASSMTRRRRKIGAR